MSATPQDIDPSRYTEGRDRYVNFATDVLDLRLGETQKRILRALTEHERILVVSGNGVGKSYTVGIGMLAYLSTNIDATVLGTSGSYSQFVDAAWRPLKRLHREAKERVGLPGTTRDGGQPELRIDDEWFAKIVSPRDPGDLEGRHAQHMLVVIEEADKAYITPEHFDSAGSSITDSNDRMLAVANPPEDESNVVYEKMQSDRWHVIQFSSFDSHNVQVDADAIDAPKIPGLIDIETIRDDWEAWNDEPWPGLADARTAHEHRTDLDTRWYRRRAGVIPPDDAAQHRPFYADAVRQAVDENTPPETPGQPIAVGVDVARKGGDETVVAILYDRTADIRAWSHTDHPENEARCRAILEDLRTTPPVAVDAQGEGSGVADALRDAYGATRFKNSENAVDGEEWDDKWTEALAHLGNYLPDLALFGPRVADDETKLRDDLFTAARYIAYDSRGLKSGDVLRATPKSELKEQLGRSPDRLDALAMAAWAAETEQTTEPFHFSYS